MNIHADRLELRGEAHSSMDVLQHISGRPEGVEAIAMARQGSASAESRLKEQGILLFRK